VSYHDNKEKTKNGKENFSKMLKKYCVATTDGKIVYCARSL